VVVTPGATDRVGALQDDKIMDAFLLEADGGAQPGKSGADDQDALTLDDRLAHVHHSERLGPIAGRTDFDNDQFQK
jgi:hypothetical protein